MELGKSYRVVDFEKSKDSAYAKRLRDLGVKRGSILAVLHQAPLAKDPIAIRVNGMVVALRRAEAACLQLEEYRETELECPRL